MVLKQKTFVDELQVEWKRLWNERLNDKVRAEGVAVDNYDSLFIDKGTIIHATRDFKVLNFKDILKQHEVENPDRYIPPDPTVGGWNKFVKDNITKQPPRKRRMMEEELQIKAQKDKPQLKKSGRGWLHM